MRIAFCGAEGTGKTTMVDALMAAPGTIKITNLTRKVPKELRGTKEGQQQILDIYWDTFKGIPDYISDRSIFDICTYSVIYSVWDEDEVDRALYHWKCYIGFPDLVFFIPPEFPLVDDGQRPIGLDREEFSFIMESILKVWKPDYVILRGSPYERLKEVNANVENYLRSTHMPDATTPRCSG